MNKKLKVQANLQALTTLEQKPQPVASVRPETKITKKKSAQVK